MFCHKCGNQVADGDRFCYKCGAKVVLGEVSSLSDSIVQEKPTEQSTTSDVIMPDAREKLEDAASKEKTYTSEISYNHLYKLLAIIGSVAYGVLFFFPWVKVIGQDWLALFGFGSVDGFNSIGLLRFVATLILGFINLFENQIDINSLDPVAVIVIIVFIWALISTITSAWGNVKNIFYLIIVPDKSKISSTSDGPLIFIIVYYIARAAIQYYITDITSDDWIGNIAGNLFGNMFQISAVPLILLLLSIINWYFIKKFLCSQTEI